MIVMVLLVTIITGKGDNVLHQDSVSIVSTGSEFWYFVNICQLAAIFFVPETKSHILPGCISNLKVLRLLAFDLFFAREVDDLAEAFQDFDLEDEESDIFESGTLGWSGYYLLEI